MVCGCGTELWNYCTHTRQTRVKSENEFSEQQWVVVVVLVEPQQQRFFSRLLKLVSLVMRLWKDTDDGGGDNGSGIIDTRFEYLFFFFLCWNWQMANNSNEFILHPCHCKHHHHQFALASQLSLFRSVSSSQPEFEKRRSTLEQKKMEK